MSREQLDRAYVLIKDGQLQEAIGIIEDVIRADRDNENAWWLLANASNDPASKRNALNNVIRTTQNAERANKSRAMLQALDQDPYNFEDKVKSKGMSSFQDEKPPARSGGMGGCAKVAIGVIAVFGICACVSIFGIYWAARPVFNAIMSPGDYESMGLVEDGFEASDSISLDNPVDGFQYRGTVGETISITVDSNSEFTPFIFIYDLEAGVLVDLGQATTPNGPAQLDFNIPSSGEYLIAIRGFTMLGQDVGYGDYDVDIEVRR